MEKRLRYINIKWIEGQVLRKLVVTVMNDVKLKIFQLRYLPVTLYASHR